MAYIAFTPTDFFNTKLYTGTGSSNAITGIGFQPDFTWIKSRSHTNYHTLTDSVRGVTKQIFSNTTDGEQTDATNLSSFDSDGFTVVSANDTNGSARTYASWNWKMGTTTGLSGGTITPSSYSIDATRKQGVYAWTGTGSAGTIAHGLGTAPDFVMVKKLNASGTYWTGYGSVFPNPTTEENYWNSDDSIGGSSTSWNSTAATSTTFSLGSSNGINGSGNTYVGYAFAQVPGYSHFTKYVGTGAAAGPFTDCGFAPALVISKAIDGAGGWYMWDNRRPGHDQIGKYLQANSSSAEDDNTGNFGCEFTSTGFRVVGTNAGVNANNVNYQVLAFAQTPLIGSDGTPATSWLGTV